MREVLILNKDKSFYYCCYNRLGRIITNFILFFYKNGLEEVLFSKSDHTKSEVKVLWAVWKHLCSCGYKIHTYLTTVDSREKWSIVYWDKFPKYVWFWFLNKKTKQTWKIMLLDIYLHVKWNEISLNVSLSKQKKFRNENISLNQWH